MRRSLAAFTIVSALVWCGRAEAHIVPEPQFVRSGTTVTLSLATPNERRPPMTGFKVTVPDGFRIVGARPTAGWAAVVDGSIATWQGGHLAHLGLETFRLDVDITADPSVVTLDSVQVYPGGATVRWPATLLVMPRARADRGTQPAQASRAAVVAGLIGVAVIVGLALLAVRQRTRTTREHSARGR